jgi:hypothetical protein
MFIYLFNYLFIYNPEDPKTWNILVVTGLRYFCVKDCENMFNIWIKRSTKWSIGTS